MTQIEKHAILHAICKFSILSLTLNVKTMRRLKRLRFLGGVFFACLLSASPPVFAQAVPVLAKELAAQKEVFQVKLDHLKEAQKGDIDSLNKRIDDALTTTSQAVDRFGVVTAWIGGLVTSLLAGLGLLGFITVTRKTKAEAEQAARDWFDDKAAALLKEIERLEKRAAEARLSMDASVKRVNDHEFEAKQAIDRQQATMERGKDDKAQRPAPSREDVSALERRDEELRRQPETSYSFDDWNARAHAAYASNKLADAIYFWTRASQVKGAGAANVAIALNNKGVAQGRMGDNEGAIESYNEVIRRFGDAPEAVLREQVAIALFNKGIRQSKIGENNIAIESYKEVIRRYGDASEAALQEQVAKALFNTGFIRGETGDQAGEIERYNEVIRRFGNSPEVILQEQVASAYNGIGWVHFVEAKRLWKTDRAAAEQLLQQARQQFDFGLTRVTEPNGMILGNRAYARFLQGDIEGAEADFRSALAAKNKGANWIYEATQKDMQEHPLDEDAGMRAMVERLWQAYEATEHA